MASEDTPLWAGGNIVTWGDARAQERTTWGDLIPVADPPKALSDLGLDLKASPRRVWRTQPSLRKVVEFTAEKISGVPLHVYRRVSDTDRQRELSTEAVFSDPVGLISAPRLIANLVTDWMLYDRWMVVLVDGHLARIPAGLIDVKSDFLGGITSLRIRTETGLQDVTDAVIAFDAGWAGDEAAGVSPLKTLGNILEEQQRATEWRTAQWKNASKITGTLNVPKDVTLGEVAYKRMKESWVEYQESLKGGTPILEKGTTFSQFDMRPVATDDLEGRKLTDAEVASFYHIPPELVGVREGNFSNINAFRQMLYGPTLGPKLSRIEAALNLRVIPWIAGDDSYVEFNREAAMAGSFGDQATIYSKAAGGPYMTRNEVRARQNLPAIDGADDLIVPTNVIVGGLASPADTAPDGDPYGEEAAQ